MGANNDQIEAGTENVDKSETVIHGLEEDNLNRLARQIATQLAEENHSPALIRGFYRLAEISSVITLGLIAYFFANYPEGSLLAHTLVIFASVGLFAFVLQICGLYTTQALNVGIRNTPRILGIWSSVFALMAMAGYLFNLHVDYSLSWLGNWFIMGVCFLAILRIGFSFSIQRWNRNGFMERRAVIIGGGPKAIQLIRDIEAEPGNDIRICGVFDDRGDHRSAPMVAGYPKLGAVRDVVAFARQTPLDMIILTLPFSAESRWVEMLKHLWVLPVDIRLASQASSMKFRPRFYTYVKNSNIPMLSLFDKPISDWNSVSKRMFDVTVTLAALLFLWPIMVITALAIKINSKGPVFFKQKRHGINNEEIMVYKFRSMYTDMSDQKAEKLVTKDDPRVTRVGRFIRKSSIDELPQLFNVLKGELSLIGPRPHAVVAKAQNKYFAEMADGYFARHRVKPGITGWAQINGYRGEITSDEKIQKRTEYDLYYIENWSLWLDIKILVKTPTSLLNTENAY